MRETRPQTQVGAALDGYSEWLAEVKERVRSTRFRATRAANVEVMRLYWSIGRDILVRRRDAGWGARVLEQAAADLKDEFPGQSGFSRTNLHYMSKVAEIWPTEGEFVQHVAEQLPWGHIMILVDRLACRADRDWYGAKAAENGWNRSTLEHFIKTGLRQQLGTAPTNFDAALGTPDSELAQQLVKDPYVFEHLALAERVGSTAVPVGHETRPGSGGHSPPRVSMAMAMRASGEWYP